MRSELAMQMEDTIVLGQKSDILTRGLEEHPGLREQRDAALNDGC